MVIHVRTPLFNYFTYLLWAYLWTDSEFSCLAMRTKAYPLSGPTYLPRFLPNYIACQEVHMRCLGLSMCPEVCHTSL